MHQMVVSRANGAEVLYGVKSAERDGDQVVEMEPTGRGATFPVDFKGALPTVSKLHGVLN